jgi:hypothetical protein
LNFISFSRQYRVGTTKEETRTTIMPPKEGIAIGTIISAPLPVEVNTGSSASIVVAEVIRHGLILRVAPITVVSRILSIEEVS